MAPLMPQPSLPIPDIGSPQSARMTTPSSLAFLQRLHSLPYILRLKGAAILIIILNSRKSQATIFAYFTVSDTAFKTVTHVMSISILEPV